MKVITGYPPNIESIHEVIDPKYTARACFTYGHAIYNPGGGYIDEPLGLHEATHSFQQDEVGGPEFWWNRWLSDPEFRLKEETVAYGHQYRRYCELEKNRNKRAVFLFNIATDLSSKQYGSVVSLQEARKRIGAYFPQR